ncbi:MAG: hypothetical protein WCJ01_02390 [Ignavibacteria bacterium]
MPEENTETDIQTIIKEVDELSGGKLKRKEDLSRLLEISIKSKKPELIATASFSAKFLTGLLSIIRRGESLIDDTVLAGYINEYMENLNKLKSGINEITSDGGKFIRQIFEEKYMAMTSESLNNLTELCSDLSWYKIYLNDKKVSR